MSVSRPPCPSPLEQCTSSYTTPIVMTFLFKEKKTWLFDPANPKSKLWKLKGNNYSFGSHSSGAVTPALVLQGGGRSYKWSNGARCPSGVRPGGARLHQSRWASQS